MDTQNFLLKREALQQRMDDHRRSVTAAAQQHGVWGWVLKGAGMVAGLSANGGSARWVNSALWAVVVPAVVGVIRRRKDSFVQRLIHAVLPFKK